jgi:hypothetical protein
MLFGVSRSGYYGWLNRSPSKRQEESHKIEIMVKVAHGSCRGVYGLKRLQAELYDNHGLTISIEHL